MTRRISILLLLSLLTAVCGASYAQQISARSTPETLLWTYTDFDELRANAREWYDIKGIDGFIFCFVNREQGGPPRIDSGPERIEQIYQGLPETVQSLKNAGITANFVHAGLDDPSWSWLDDTHVAKLVPTFRALAKVAKESGCRGVAIDTEAYSPTLWDPTTYPEDRRDDVAKRIHKAGGDIMDAILSEFPEAEILILPEGAYAYLMETPRGHHTYDWWIQFYNGVASKKPSKGITILTESAYHQKNPLAIAVMHGRLQATMMLLAEDENYWLTKCSIAHGADLYLKDTSKQDRTPNEFARQWKTMGALSPRYRWIFGGESGLAYYPPGVDKLGVKAFGEPLCKNADEYFKVLRDRTIADH